MVDETLFSIHATRKPYFLGFECVILKLNGSLKLVLLSFDVLSFSTEYDTPSDVEIQ